MIFYSKLEIWFENCILLTRILIKSNVSITKPLFTGIFLKQKTAYFSILAQIFELTFSLELYSFKFAIFQSPAKMSRFLLPMSIFECFTLIVGKEKKNSVSF